jgi:hypothetical protein
MTPPPADTRSQTHEMEILGNDTPLVLEPSTRKDLRHDVPAVAEDPIPGDVTVSDEQSQYVEGGFGWTIVLCKIHHSADLVSDCS